MSTVSKKATKVVAKKASVKRNNTNNTPKSKFISQATAELDKTEKDIAIENVQNFLAVATIDCETEITMLKSDLSKAQVNLKKDTSVADRASEEYNKSKFEAASSFESYLRRREDRRVNAERATNSVAARKNEIKDIETKIAKFEAILADLKS